MFAGHKWSRARSLSNFSLYSAVYQLFVTENKCNDHTVIKKDGSDEKRVAKSLREFLMANDTKLRAGGIGLR